MPAGPKPVFPGGSAVDGSVPWLQDRSQSDGQLAFTAQSRRPNNFGLKVWHDPVPALIDIVFVHGLTDDRESTWTAPGATSPWPQTLLPSRLPEARIISFGYDASIVGWRPKTSRNRIGNHSKNLLHYLANLRDDDGTNDRPLFFVAHSAGGLICEDALLASKNSAEPHDQRILECTRGLMFFGTPHSGSALPKWANATASILGLADESIPPILKALESDSEVLARIQSEFQTMLRHRKYQSIEITSFYEELDLDGVGKVVSMDSAILPGSRHHGIYDDHIGMTKFSAHDDPGFVDVTCELRRWVRDISKQDKFNIHEANQPFKARVKGNKSRHVLPETQKTPDAIPAFSTAGSQGPSSKANKDNTLDQFEESGYLRTTKSAEPISLKSHEGLNSQQDNSNATESQPANGNSDPYGKRRKTTSQRATDLEQYQTLPDDFKLPQNSTALFRLISANPDISEKVYDGRLTLLHVAAFFGDLKAIKYLSTDWPLNCCSKDASKNTPLHLAVLGNHFDVVKELLTAGADDKAKNSSGDTPYMTAAVEGNFECFQQFNLWGPIGNKKIIYTINQMACKGRFDVISKLLESDLKMNFLGEDCSVPLFLAAKSNEKKVLTGLIKRGARVVSPESRLENYDHLFTHSMGDIFLSLALDVENAVCIRYLVEAGADLNVVDESGNTALHGAALTGSSQAVEALLRYGATPFILNNSIEMPIDIANKRGHYWVSGILLKGMEMSASEVE